MHTLSFSSVTNPPVKYLGWGEDRQGGDSQEESMFATLKFIVLHHLILSDLED